METSVLAPPDATYPYLTALSDWPEGSHEHRWIKGGEEVFLTGPAYDMDGSGKLQHPLFFKPRDYTGVAPWASIKALPDEVTIYFIGPKDGPVKIGFARRLEFRLKELRLANAFPLEVWASVQAPPSLERDYHKRFKAHRLHGEWFARCPEIEAEIARLKAEAEV